METSKTTQKDFFLYVGAMITLFWSAGSLIALLFAIVDAVFKDQLGYYVDPYSGGIRFAIASLVVAFPVSILLFKTIKRDVVLHPEKLLLSVRKWLFALTIFVTSVALVGDVIALLNTFLGGEITTRFVLKVLSVLAVAGLMLWYALLELRAHPENPARVRKEFLWGTPVLVLLAIVYGFSIMGSPTLVRSLRFDEQRVLDLQSIQWHVVNYWQQKGKLPKSLADINDPISGYKNPRDPHTKEEYKLVLGEGQSFKLCAVFEQKSPNRGEVITKPYGVENWNHEAGAVCFLRVIDTELYPVRAKGF